MLLVRAGGTGPGHCLARRERGHAAVSGVCLGGGGEADSSYPNWLAPPSTRLTTSLPQLNLIVAGLWAIFYYEEICGSRLIAIFLTAMLIDVGGAVLLNI